MRPWVLMRQVGIPFEEVLVRFDSFDADSGFKHRVAAYSPAGKVPVLVEGDLHIWDSLAICEYLAERFAHLALWPQAPHTRAQARSVCAEMHAGFGALRSHCPMNIEASLPEAGRRIWQEQPGVRADVNRITALWQEALAQHGGPMLFGPFSIADAYFAPVCMRFHTYQLPLTPEAAAYVERVRALPAVQEWVQAALAEHDFRPFEEPYRRPDRDDRHPAAT